MSIDENKAVVRRFIELAFNNGHLDILDEIVGERFVLSIALNRTPPIGPGQSDDHFQAY